jgi:hypothetical protein
MCGIYLWQNNTCQSLHIYFKLRPCEWIYYWVSFFYGLWYWYTWIKSRFQCRIHTSLNEMVEKKLFSHHYEPNIVLIILKCLGKQRCGILHKCFTTLWLESFYTHNLYQDGFHFNVMENLVIIFLFS